MPLYFEMQSHNNEIDEKVTSVVPIPGVSKEEYPPRRVI